MQQKQEKKHLLVIEDDEILSGFLDRYLLRHAYQPLCITDGEHIPMSLEKQRFDAVILDLTVTGSEWFILAEMDQAVPLIFARRCHVC